GGVCPRRRSVWRCATRACVRPEPLPAAAPGSQGAATSRRAIASGARRTTVLLRVRREDLAHVVAHAVVAREHRVAAPVAVVEHVGFEELLVLAQQLDAAG